MTRALRTFATGAALVLATAGASAQTADPSSSDGAGQLNREMMQMMMDLREDMMRGRAGEMMRERMQRGAVDDPADGDDTDVGERTSRHGMYGGHGMRGDRMGGHRMGGYGMGRYGMDHGRSRSMDMGAHARGPMMRIMFAIIDTNGDGALQLEEVQDFHARIFRAVDADGDGGVTPAELRAFLRGDDADAGASTAPGGDDDRTDAPATAQ